MLIQIKAQLPQSESERTWSRLVLLLCETEDSIFTYDQFNGHIEAEKPSVKLKSIELSESEANVQKCSAISRGMFTEQRRKQKEVFLIEHRHDNAELQHEYDKRFGISGEL